MTAPLTELYAHRATPAVVAAAIAEQARRAARDPRTALLARAELAPFPGPLVEALGLWARSIAPVREPLDGAGEIIVSPWRTAAYKRGDCDDVTAAVCAFAATLGLPAAAAIVSTSPGYAHAIALIGDDPYRPGRLTHRVDQAVGTSLINVSETFIALAGVR